MLLTSSNDALAVLDPEANPLSSRVIASLCDIALVLDLGGRIADVTVGQGLAASSGWRKLIGQRLVDVLSSESQEKANQFMREAATGHTQRSREMNLVVEGVGAVPFRFTGALINEQHVLAFGIDISSIAAIQQNLVNAQQAMEMECQRVRQSEAQYRVLFHVCAEGVLLAQGRRHLVSDANPAALKLLGRSADAVHGKPLRDLVSPQSHEALAALIASVEAGKSLEVPIVIGTESPIEALSSLTIFRQSGRSVFLLRFWPRTRSEPAALDSHARVLKVIQAMPDGFVVTDDQLRILSANASFCELVERPSEGEVVGTTLDRWMGRAGVDLNIIVSNLRAHGLVRSFSTVVRSEFGAERGATVTAVATPDGEVRCFGFTIRPTLQAVGGRMGSFQSRTPEQLQALVGRTSLREIVQESADMIERLCIEAALEVSGNNRAGAAQLLGLSRQSLYTKMRRHGLEEFQAKPERDWEI